MMTMVDALHKVRQRTRYPLAVMSACVRWYAAYPLPHARVRAADAIPPAPKRTQTISSIRIRFGMSRLGGIGRGPARYSSRAGCA